MSSELVKKSIAYATTGAVGTHGSHAVAELTGSLRGHVYNMIGKAATAVLPTSVINGVSTVAESFFSGLGYITDVMQAPINKISNMKTEHTLNLPTMEAQQSFGAKANLISRTVLAPIIEEFLYRGPQIIGGKLLEKATGLDPVASQLLVGAITNTLFGLAHTVGRTGMERLNSREFVASFSKGIALAVSSAMVSSSGGKEDSAVTKGIAAFVTTVTAHALSNLPDAIKFYNREMNA